MLFRSQNRSGQFGLSFSPEEEALFLITRKRYEEDRRSYVGRANGLVRCDDKGGCPAGYDCQTSGTGDNVEHRCVAKSDKVDNRVLKETLVGDLTLGKPDAAGLSKASVAFVAEAEWRNRHPAGSIQIEVPLPAPPGGWPVSTDGKKEDPHVEMKTLDRLVTWWPQPKGPKGETKKINLPVDLQELPLVQKEQCAPLDRKSTRLNSSH